MSLRRNKAFTIIEALISTLIFSIVIISIAYLITNSALYTRDRAILECLVNAASSGIEACRGGININQIECNGLNIQVNVNIDCSNIPFPSYPWSANCERVRVIASYRNQNCSMTDLICKFWGGNIVEESIYTY